MVGANCRVFAASFLQRETKGFHTALLHSSPHPNPSPPRGEGASRLPKTNVPNWKLQIIRGLWEHQGQTYRDELIRIFVDVDDTPGDRRFFEEFKERLKTRFRQIDI